MKENNIYVKWLKPKLKKLIDKGYSVKWHHLDNWVIVTKSLSEMPSELIVRGAVKVFRLPSTFGINNGHISKCSIEILPDYPNYWHNRENCKKYYNYDRGLDFKRLSKNKNAKQMYNDLLEVFS